MFSVVVPDPYWIPVRIQELSGSVSVFRSFLDPDPNSEYGSAHVNKGQNGGCKISDINSQF